MNQILNMVLDVIREKYARIAGIAAFCVVIWFAAPLISIGSHAPFVSEFNRLLLILAIVLVWVVYEIIRRKRIAKKDLMLMNEIAGPTQPDRAAVEEARSEEIATLKSKFDEALQLLKKTQPKGKKNKHYLYELPWYVIIGGPGTGKTTLLKNSGLQFPLSDRLGGGAVKGVGGTRDCDWFFTDEAVFLDTAGRYTTQDSFQEVDKFAWKGFLDLLKKTRPRRPINGVLLTMSISELLVRGEDERRQHARELRQRIMELQEVLGHSFPIYMILTKSDLIAGFNDFFADMDQEERSVVWGETFTNDRGRRVEKNIELFEANFEIVLQRMQQRVLKRIQEERDLQRRCFIMSFPRQLTILKPAITAFLRDVFASTRYEVEPFLRGVYLTSATQEGTPIDRMMGVLAGAFGIDRQQAPIFSGRGKSYFINRLLMRVMLPEAELAGTDPKIEQRRRRLRLAACSALLLILASMFTLWSISYYENSNAIAKVEEKLKQYREVPQQWSDGDTALRTILARLNAIAEARGEYPDQSWKMGFGLYQGDKIRAAIDDVYEQRLKADLLPEIVRRLKMNMVEITRAGQTADLGLLHELLRAYLVLGLPNRKDTKLAEASVKKCWEQVFPREPRVVDQLCVHSDHLLNRFRDRIALDEDIVGNAQRKIKAVPLATQIYAHLKNVALADRTYDFRLKEILPHGSSDALVISDGRDIDSVIIPGLYTLQGYKTHFKKQGLELVRQALKEDWVLDRHASRQPANLDLLYDDLQKLYFAEYESLWLKLLSDMKIKKPSGMLDTLRVLDVLSGPDTPLRPLLQAVEKNTCLSSVRADSSDGKTIPPDAAPQSASFLMSGKHDTSSDPVHQLEAKFQRLNQLVQTRGQAPPPIDGVIKNILEVRDVMLRMTGGASGEEQALRFAKERMKGSGAADIIKKADLDFARLPEPLNGWLRSLTSSGLGLTLEKAKTELNTLWRGDVASHYSMCLKGRYPLVKNSRVDATLADFTRFFAPKGILDQFFEAHIKSLVNMSGPKWRPISADNQLFQVSGDVVAQFQNASKIRNAFFPTGETALGVQFQLKPIGVDGSVAGFQINIEGQTVEYAHGPPIPVKIRWPGPDPGAGVVLTFVTSDSRTVSKVEEGPWALFRALEKASIEPAGRNEVFRVTFQADGYKARYELRADSVYNPFKLPELQQFRCPESL